MGHVIIKPRPGLNFYLVWSSVVDNVIHVGTAYEVGSFWLDHNGHWYPDAGERVERMMEAADVHGTSATAWRSPWRSRPHREGGWRDNGFVVNNGPVGWLERRHFLPFAQAMRAGKMTKAARLVSPFEDQAAELESCRRTRRQYRTRRGTRRP